MANSDGTRQTLVAILAAELLVKHPASPWKPGPLPVQNGHLRADLEMRLGYFLPAVSRVLYGPDMGIHRWHLETSQSYFEGQLVALEILQTATKPEKIEGLVVLHLEVAQRDLLGVARRFAGRTPTPETDLPEIPSLGQVAAISWHGRLRYPFVHIDAAEAPFTIALATPTNAPLPNVYPASSNLGWEAADEWLFTLAARASWDDYPPHPTHQNELPNAIFLSASWKALVLGRGAAFVGLRPGDSFYPLAELYVRSLFLDTLLYAIIQHDQLASLANDAARVLESRDQARRLAQLVGLN